MGRRCWRWPGQRALSWAQVFQVSKGVARPRHVMQPGSVSSEVPEDKASSSDEEEEEEEEEEEGERGEAGGEEEKQNSGES